MTFATLTAASSTVRHGGRVEVEAFFQGYGLRLSDGLLIADRTGNRPQTFETRADALSAAERISR